VRLAQHTFSSPVDLFVYCDGVALNAIDLAPRRLRIAGDQIDRRPARQPPLRSGSHRGHHLQIP